MIGSVVQFVGSHFSTIPQGCKASRRRRTLAALPLR
jgi:hypothetical protein